MRIAIYRTTEQHHYPSQSLHTRYDFEPIESSVVVHSGGAGITRSTNPSDTPCGYITVPDGSTVDETNGGELAVFLPGQTVGVVARDAIEAYPFDESLG
jgi:hypothetical protein